MPADKNHVEFRSQRNCQVKENIIIPVWHIKMVREVTGQYKYPSGEYEEYDKPVVFVHHQCGDTVWSTEVGHTKAEVLKMIGWDA